MTRRHLVAMTIIVLGFASGAFAQTADDASYFASHPGPSFDGPPGSSEPRGDPRRDRRRERHRDSDDNALRRRVLPGPGAAGAGAATDSRRRPGTAGRTIALPVRTAGDHQTVQSSHEVLGLYEHGIEANALKNYYNSGR